MVNIAAAPFCHMVIYGYSLQRALNEFLTIDRDLSVVELWSGVGSVAAAGEELGLKCHQFDLLRKGPDVEETEDMLTPQGFQVALQRVMRLKNGGLLWMAPPCSSWVFMNTKNTKRCRENPLGDTSYKPVADGNLQAEIMIFFFVLALLRTVHPVCEQPVGSQMHSHPLIAHVAQMLKPTFAICARCVFDTKEFGSRWLKKFKFMGERWVKHLAKKCACPGHKHADLVLKVMVRARGKVKRIKLTGKRAELTLSGSYPPSLGRFIVQTWNSQKDQDQAVESPKIKVRKTIKKPPSKKDAAPASTRSKTATPAPTRSKTAPPAWTPRATKSSAASWKVCSSSTAAAEAVPTPAWKTLGSSRPSEPTSSASRATSWKALSL